jgi:hypothetical protein
MNVPESSVQSARQQLDQHVREVVHWHFSPETGCAFWLDWAKQAGWDPRREIGSFSDLVARFPHFQDEWLRDLQPEVWVPAKFKGRPYNIFETGGTTGMPKQRIGWDDYKTDYEEFSGKISDEHFPRGAAWLMVGPTGPRRLRLAIEHLANFRGSPCYFIDLDPRWVKRVIAEKKLDEARAYMDHVIGQAVTILKHRRIAGLFTTPKLLEALGEKLDLYEAGSARKPHWVLSNVRKHVDGSGRQRAAPAARPILHHLLCPTTTRRPACREPAPNRSGSRIRRVGPRRIDQLDARVLHAAFPRA